MDYDFDHIQDFLDVVPFPEQPWSPPFPLSDSSVFCNSEIYDDIFQMEWLPTFVDPSDHPPRTPSPVSVLDTSTSSSSSSADKSSHPIVPSPRGRARTKRSRPITAPQLPPSVLSPASELSPAVEKEEKKEKKIKFTLSAPPPAAKGDGDPSIPLTVRKCQHCEITKTPQWRAGPMGPKTLCNACGVRYKSGRLFPEYRPAASPTFVPSVHSNSHKKVMEMRKKVVPGDAAE